MKTGAIIVLYNPDAKHLCSMLETLRASDIFTVVVDNSAFSHAEIFPSHVNYLHFPENVGIAAAQNAGIIALRDSGYDAAFVFDQDSHLTQQLLCGLIAQLQASIQENPKIAAIGPTVICGFNQTAQIPKLKYAHESGDLISVSQIIASGMLIFLAHVNVIGLKDESLFIDGVDHEWCWRARSKGFAILIAKNILMHHKQGDARHTYFGITFKRGAPIRLYYQVRNVLKLCRRNYVPIRWKVRNLLALPLRWVVNRFLFPDGPLRGKYTKLGFRDGIKNRSGKINV
ncbi:glycosyltransferase family 2 protein [Alteromonas ponticola]|uniref:Glycosyltransferase family 2 protein n=1 Tax=Alteromonas aquimaris TaxID=2998417 RepID=A0ABT3P435_9ALTE|nr:glycosyltransferase family 2 protein [Alteromonas aquimaris]MCW8107518.1 glycosyltransferase family 2 protein [Alteromonas aquimaris]